MKTREHRIKPGQIEALRARNARMLAAKETAGITRQAYNEGRRVGGIASGHLTKALQSEVVRSTFKEISKHSGRILSKAWCSLLLSSPQYMRDRLYAQSQEVPTELAEAFIPLLQDELLKYVQQSRDDVGVFLEVQDSDMSTRCTVRWPETVCCSTVSNQAVTR